MGTSSPASERTKPAPWCARIPDLTPIIVTTSAWNWARQCTLISHLILELLLAEPRVRHVLLHVVVVLVVLIVALRPRPERH